MVVESHQILSCVVCEVCSEPELYCHGVDWSWGINSISGHVCFAVSKDWYQWSIIACNSIKERHVLSNSPCFHFAAISIEEEIWESIGRNLGESHWLKGKSSVVAEVEILSSWGSTCTLPTSAEVLWIESQISQASAAKCHLCWTDSRRHERESLIWGLVEDEVLGQPTEALEDL